MPPPIQSQSGSRAALVTWTVVASILFVVATVLAIFSSVSANKAQAELVTAQQSYDAFVSAADLNGELKTNLEKVKAGNPTVYTGNLLNVALTQRDTLARKLAGGSADDAAAKADAALARVKTANLSKVSGDNLSTLSDSLLLAVKERDQSIKDLQTAAKKQQADYDELKNEVATQVNAMKGDLAKANAGTAAANASAATYRTTKDDDIAKLQAGADEANKVATDTVNQLSAQQQADQGTIKKQGDQLKALQNKLREIRQPVDQIVRQPDAHVMRVSGDTILYIDLGTGDQVSPGMSFEIYDRISGVPKNGEPTNDEALPKGKASIEILKVSPGSSECRIVRQTPGETVVEGDIVANVVYDKNIKYNVLVFGNFDLDRNGQATPQDADVVKRLVTKWGGKVTTKLNADTDFVVIGKMPEVPTPSPEDADRPEVQFEVDRKKKELAEYDEILGQAFQLNIPVLNQNRFLYFTGYYEQSAR